MDQETAFGEFKARCVAEGFVDSTCDTSQDDTRTGINDDGTLRRFLTARGFDVNKAFQQYQETRKWREANQLIELYDSIEVSDYEETRKMYTHWIGRRDLNGMPICLFQIGHLTSGVMEAYNKSCLSKANQGNRTETEAMLRLFCTYENLVRFVFPLCSAVRSQSDPESPPVTATTSIVDISNVGLWQLWRLRGHMQAASTLATAHYPETLGRTFIIGAPSFFPTVWAWINGWFDQNTVSKIRIVPAGEELSTLSQDIDPANIPQIYGGKLNFEFGMLPDLDDDIKGTVRWLQSSDGSAFEDLPMGPLRWIHGEDGQRRALAVGTVDGVRRNENVMALS